MSARSKGAVVAAIRPHLPDGRRPRSRPSDRRHRVLGSGCRLRDPVQRPLVHPDARPRARDPAAVERVRALWAGIGANVETMSAEHHDHVLAITSHLPHLIAYNIVGTAADLEAATPVRGDQVLGQRLPRLHPHRRLRPDHVARHLPQQPRGGAGDARPLQRGPVGAAPRRSAGATATPCTRCSPAPGRSGAASSRRARRPRPRISAGRGRRRNRGWPTRGFTPHPLQKRRIDSTVSLLPLRGRGGRP